MNNRFAFSGWVRGRAYVLVFAMGVTFSASAQSGLAASDEFGKESQISDVHSTKRDPETPALKRRGENLFSVDYLKLVAEDVRETVCAPADWEGRDWLTFAGVAAGIAGISWLDEEVRDGVQDVRSDPLDDISKGFEPLGAEYSFGVLGGFYLGGVLFKDDRAKATALDGLSASFISGLLVTEPLKWIVGRHRPQKNEGQYEFQPFGSDHAFPSGHATQAFAVATVIAEHYESLWVKVVSYGLAGMVGFARIEQDDHWASDVAAGAAIGTCVAHFVVRYNEQQRALKLEPMVGLGLQGLKISYSF